MTDKARDSLQQMTNDSIQLVRGLGLLAAISINVSNVIGTGVFLKARVMTCNVGTPGKALMVWVFAGLLSLAGALTYACLQKVNNGVLFHNWIYTIVLASYVAAGLVIGWLGFRTLRHLSD